MGAVAFCEHHLWSTIPCLLNTNDKRSSLGLQGRAIRFPAGCDRAESHVMPADWLAKCKMWKNDHGCILDVFVHGNATKSTETSTPTAVRILPYNTQEEKP